MGIPLCGQLMKPIYSALVFDYIQKMPLDACQDVHLHSKWNYQFVIIRLLCVTGLDYQLLHGLNEIAPVNIGNGTAAGLWDSTIHIKNK
jgi:hypothetical protein